MEKAPVMEDETLEELQPYGFSLLQKKNGFRFGMDSVLLAEFAGIRPDDCVVDFGTGSGVLPLLLIGRNKGSTFECIEIQREIAEMARRTVQINHLDSRIRIIHGPAEEAASWIQPCSIDAVICNPPYALPGSALSSPVPSRSISRNQQSNLLSGFFRSAFQILKGRGKLSLVFPASGMLYVMMLLREAHLEPKRFQLVYPYEEKPANLVLIEAVKDAKPTLHPMPPLIVYTKDHLLTNRLRSVYHMDQNTV